MARARSVRLFCMHVNESTWGLVLGTHVCHLVFGKYFCLLACMNLTRCLSMVAWFPIWYTLTPTLSKIYLNTFSGQFYLLQQHPPLCLACCHFFDVLSLHVAHWISCLHQAMTANLATAWPRPHAATSKPASPVAHGSCPTGPKHQTLNPKP